MTIENYMNETICPTANMRGQQQSKIASRSSKNLKISQISRKALKGYLIINLCNNKSKDN